ncbi:site-specific integrase [Bifidobacterium thermophilum]|uniref:tyrosine-type recombinase/integrase n=1 Tax=Bifidobacterium thermophilum TaxID=33905 RepID=UPI0030AEB6D6
MMRAQGWLDDEYKKLTEGPDGGWKPVKLRKLEAKKRDARDGVTFAAYAQTWLDTRRLPNGEPIKQSSKTKHREKLRNHLIPFFGNIRMVDITPKVVQEWWDTYDTQHDPHAAGARNAAYETLKAIMHTAENETYPGIDGTLIIKSPCRIKAARPAKRHKTVNASTQQLIALADAMDALRPGIGLTAWIMGRLGLRIGETLALQRGDIDVEHGVLYVRRTLTQVYDDKTDKTITTVGTPKTKDSAAPVQFGENMAKLFEAHLRDHVASQPEAWLFPTNRGTTMTEANYRDRYFNPAKKTVPGLEDYWPHDGRHTAGTYTMENGASPNMVKQQLRHSDVRMTNKYLDTTSEQHRRAIITRVDDELAGYADRKRGDDTTDTQDAQDTPDTPQAAPSPTSVSASAGTPVPASAPATGTDTEPGGRLGMVVAQLRSLSEDVQVSVLVGMDDDRRGRVLPSLSKDVQARVMGELIRKAV